MQQQSTPSLNTNRSYLPQQQPQFTGSPFYPGMNDTRRKISGTYSTAASAGTAPGPASSTSGRNHKRHPSEAYYRNNVVSAAAVPPPSAARSASSSTHSYRQRSFYNHQQSVKKGDASSSSYINHGSTACAFPPISTVMGSSGAVDNPSFDYQFGSSTAQQEFPSAIPTEGGINTTGRRYSQMDMGGSRMYPHHTPQRAATFVAPDMGNGGEVFDSMNTSTRARYSSSMVGGGNLGSSLSPTSSASRVHNVGLAHEALVGNRHANSVQSEAKAAVDAHYKSYVNGNGGGSAAHPHRRSMVSKTWYGPSQKEFEGRGATSDIVGWGLPDTSRMRGKTVAYSNAGSVYNDTPGSRFGYYEQQQQQQQQQPPPQMMRGNGLAFGESQRAHRVSYQDSVHGSHNTSAAGNRYRKSRHNTMAADPTNINRSMFDTEAAHPPSTNNILSIAGSHSPVGSGIVIGHYREKSSGKNSGKSKENKPMLHAKNGKTPIKSNWYHREEMLSESDLKDQEFLSSDEEDFGNEDKEYVGDMVAQQKLIQKQQREIYDLKMHAGALERAIKSKTGTPHEAITHELNREVARNRKKKRQIGRMENKIQELVQKCEEMEADLANPPSCQLQHGMSEEQEEEMERLRGEAEETKRRLDSEVSMAQNWMAQLGEKDTQINQLKSDVAREQHNSEQLLKELLQLRVALQEARTSGFIVNGLSTRGRAGTTTNTNTSETLTLRGGATSDIASNGITDDVSKIRNGVMGYPATPTSTAASANKVDEHWQTRMAMLQSKHDKLEAALEQVTNLKDQHGDELLKLRRELREKDEKYRLLQREMNNSLATSRLVVANGGSEMTKLVKENESLKDECDVLRQKLVSAKAAVENNNQTASLVAALGKLGLEEEEDDDDDIGSIGSASQRANVARLELECRDWRDQTEVLSEYVENLKNQLDSTKEQLRMLSHDYLRPHLREATAGPTQAEKVRDQVRQWSQLKVIVPPE